LQNSPSCDPIFEMRGMWPTAHGHLPFFYSEQASQNQY